MGNCVSEPLKAAEEVAVETVNDGLKVAEAVAVDLQQTAKAKVKVSSFEHILVQG